MFSAVPSSSSELLFDAWVVACWPSSLPPVLLISASSNWSDSESEPDSLSPAVSPSARVDAEVGFFAPLASLLRTVFCFSCREWKKQQKVTTKKERNNKNLKVMNQKRKRTTNRAQELGKTNQRKEQPRSSFYPVAIRQGN